MSRSLVRSCLPFAVILVLASFVAADGGVQRDDHTLLHHLNDAMIELEAEHRLPYFSDVAHLPAESMPELQPAGAESLTGPDLVARLRAATVMFHTAYKCSRCKNWHGGVATGFIIHPDGWIVTAAHVVNDLPDDHAASVMTVDEKTYPITGVWAVDDDRDIAIVKVDAEDLPTMPLANVEPAPGSAAYVMSHPRGHFYVLTNGMVSRVMDGTEPNARLEITADFAKGSSGAPVVDATCSVIGIALSTVTLNADEDAKLDTQMVLKRCAGVTDLRELIAETRAAKSE